MTAIPVLENISFDFPEGAVTALRGPSGCGKTTLVNIILGLLEPDAGEVRMPANARVAAVFQEDRLIEHFSAAQNVRLAAPASVTDAQIRAALNGLGLADEGEKRVSQFSGGMRRRVAVIRAALYQPQVLLLDEPFKGLDDDMRAKTAAFLCRTCAQATTILVTHDGTEAALMGAQAGLDIGGKDGKELKRKFINGFQLWAAGYAVLTVVGAIAQLINGTGTDTNINVLTRAIACLVPIVTYYLFGFGTQRKRSKGLLMLVLHYAISLACAWLLIYLAGLLQKRADIAYWDLLISFTIAYALIAAIIAVGKPPRPQGARARGIGAGIKRPHYSTAML